MKASYSLICLTLAASLALSTPAFGWIKQFVFISGVAQIDMIYPNLYRFTLKNPSYNIAQSTTVEENVGSGKMKVEFSPSLISQYMFTIVCFGADKSSSDGITMINTPQVSDHQISFEMVPISNPSDLMNTQFINGKTCSLAGVILGQ